MKTKQKKFTEFEKVLFEITGIVGQTFNKNKITYYEAVGVFEAAKHLFIQVDEEHRLNDSEEQNEN